MDRMDEILRRLKPLIGKKADKLWLAYQSEPKERRTIESLIEILSSKYLGESYERERILLEPPPEEKAYGEYKLGTVCYGDKRYYPFGMRENEWIQHVGIFGRPGSGKTNLGFLIIWNLLAKKKPFWVFDWKRNYRDLLSLIQFKDMLVFTLGRESSPFFFNPFVPPPHFTGYKYLSYLRAVVALICDSYFPNMNLLSVQGVEYLLLKAADTLISDGRRITFQELYDWIKRYRGRMREKDWRSSALNSLYKLCTGPTGLVFNASEAFKLDKLLDANVIFELDSLGSEKDKSFFIKALFLWVHHYRLANGEKELFKHAMLIEEAHHILLRKKQELSGEEGIMDITLREIRELGESIILIDQHPSLISIPALGNTYTTIAMNLKHRADINMIANAISLSAEDKDFLGRLPVGYAVVKLQERWFKPFTVKFPLFSIKKGSVTDEQIQRHMRGCSGQLGLFASEGKENEAFREVRKRDKKEEKTGENSTEEQKLLIDIAGHPFSKLVERYKRLGLNAYQGNRLKNSVTAKGLARVRTIPTHEGRIKLLELTEKGMDMIDGAGLTLQQNASIEHEYWKWRVAEFYKGRGYVVEKEKHVNGGNVDIVVKTNRETIAIEIETGKSDMICNIKKDLEAGFDRVISVALSEGLKSKIQRRFKDIGLQNGRVRVLSVGELFRRGKGD